jgi:hypothetical protein
MHIGNVIDMCDVECNSRVAWLPCMSHAENDVVDYLVQGLVIVDLRAPLMHTDELWCRVALLLAILS